MKYLPAEDEQEWLLAELRNLIRVQGFETFVRAPIVEPTPKFFPDPVTSLPSALDRITRRLLQYAGLADLDVTLDLFAHGEVDNTATGTRCHGIAGCFYGIENGCCHFGFNVDLCPGIEDLAGVMCHEVAHAYRSYHRLQVDDVDKEERLTDLTTIYLGFGILSVNSSYRFRKSGWVEGSMAYTSWSTWALGYLPPQALSFLLGTQIQVRSPNTRDRKAVYRHLEANQAVFLKAAVKKVETENPNLELLLGLPQTASWPPEKKLDEILQPLEPCALAGEVPRDEVAKGVPWNQGRPVFRIRESRIAEHAFFRAACLGVVGFVASTVMFRSWLGLMPFALVGLMWGIRSGRAATHDVCSDAGCRAELAAGLTRCPHCGGEIMSHIESVEDRLEMEENFAEAAKKRAATRKR